MQFSHLSYPNSRIIRVITYRYLGLKLTEHAKWTNDHTNQHHPIFTLGNTTLREYDVIL